MDSFELLSIPRFMGHESEVSPTATKSDSNKSDLISKLISESKARKRLRLRSEITDKQDITACEEVDDTVGQRSEESDNDIVDDTAAVEGEEAIGEEVDTETTEEVPSDVFPVIGQKIVENNKRIVKITDKWLTKPISFDGNIQNSKPLEELSEVIDKSLISLLTDNGIKRLFPVQQQVIPYLTKSFNNANIIRPKDICVCSPTGSGKTLAFVLPIVQYLQNRVVTRVRALVVLPVRDLALQVFQVFQTYCKKSSLRVGLVVGHKSFAEECDSIVRKSVDGSQYRSLVDILVATPGKLVDLIQRGDGFDLTHLEVLVLDESDRMIAELQFNWLQEIETAVFGTNRRHHCYCSVGDTNDKPLMRHNIGNECSCYNRRSLNGRPIHKILFSATLSTDPEKLKFVSLYQPILFSVASDSNNLAENRSEVLTKHMIPKELKEFMIISNDDRKPLIVWYLMEVLKYRRVLCFTGSVENCHRLHSLLKGMSSLVITEFSSRLNAKKREKLLNEFTNEKIDLIICSDIFARGLDINGVNYVICYDPPRNETQYIHRIGRTARAGNEGTAITLLTPKQLSHFTIISRRVHQKNGSNDKNNLIVKKMVVKESQFKPMIETYRKCLQRLSKDIKYDEKRKSILKRNFKHK